MESCRSPGSAKSKKSENICNDTGRESIDIIYTNAQSVINKINELRVIVSDLKPDIILINESWTHGDITKSFLTIDGFELVSRSDRTDTSNGRGGGLLIYAKFGLVVEELPIHSEFSQYAPISITSKPANLILNLVY